MSDIKKLIIGPLTAIFGKPNMPDPLVFVAVLERELGGVPESILEEATKLLIRRHAYWPKPKECLDAVEAVKARCARLNELRAQSADAPTPRPTPSPEEKASVQAQSDNLKRFLLETDPKPSFSELPRVDREAWEARQCDRRMRAECARPRVKRRGRNNEER
jgi:hypothetical protein